MAIEQGKNWPFDPEVKNKGHGGGPPPLHQRKCQSSKRDGTQCPFWASTQSHLPDGTGFCKSHQGKRRLNDRPKSMSGLYSARASKNLKELLEKAAKGGDKERLRLGDELDVARVMAERAIRLFDGACCGPSADKADSGLKHTVMVMVRDSLKLVSDLAGQYGKLMLVSDDVFNTIQVDHIMAGIGEILTKHLEDPKIIDTVLQELGKLVAPDKQPKRAVSITIGA